MMSPEKNTHSVLRRKARRRGAEAAAASVTAGPESILRALRRAMARAGQNEMALTLDVGEVAMREEASLAEVLDMPEMRSLLAILEGPGDALGLFALGPEVLEGVLQQQTTGSVHPSSAPPRVPTRIDAAMSAGLIDRILAEFEAALAATPDLAWAGGFRYASFLDEPRTLGLLLEDIAYRVFRIDAELAGGVRHGTILLALPAEGAVAAGDAGRVASNGARTAAPSESDWQAAMSQAVMASPVQLRAVLGRMSLPLGSVMAWQAGDVIALPMARLDGVTLDGPGTRGLVLGQLGQSRGFRALRLSATPGEAADPGAESEEGERLSTFLAGATPPTAAPPDPDPDPVPHETEPGSAEDMPAPASIDPLDPPEDLLVALKG